MFHSDKGPKIMPFNLVGIGNPVHEITEVTISLKMLMEEGWEDAVLACASERRDWGRTGLVGAGA